MLLVIYGSYIILGNRSREYLQKKGYEEVDQYCVSDDGTANALLTGTAVTVSEEEFSAKTDVLFRHTVSGVRVGFDWNQISDAVYGGKNKMLTYAESDTAKLRQIKEVYKDTVHLMYFHIDPAAFEGLFTVIPDEKKKDFGSYVEIGLSIKKNFSRNTDLFDSVVIYGGEHSLLNYDSLCRQFDSILDEPKTAEEHEEVCSDIFFVNFAADNKTHDTENCHDFINELVKDLCSHGLNVYHMDHPSDDDNAAAVIRNNIRRSSVYVPVLTEGSTDDPHKKELLISSIKAAKNNGLIIMPVYYGKVNPVEALSLSRPFLVSGKENETDLERISTFLTSVFTGEEALKKLTDEIKVCIDTGMYKKAFSLQGTYLRLLDEFMHEREKKGSQETVNALIRYLKLAETVNDHSAGQKIVSRLLSEVAEKPENSFTEKAERTITDYWRKSDLKEDDLIKEIKENGKIGTGMKHRFIENIGKPVNMHVPAAGSKSHADTALAEKIAEYSNASIELFEELFRQGTAPGLRETLITAYDRIIDYCRDVRLGSEIAEQCMNRISELKSLEAYPGEMTAQGEKTLRSLKVYLGQALPETGCYDVFISHKSADDLLADKIYNYLKTCGYEVFCDHHTLHSLRDSEYDRRITSAIQNAKHMVLVASNPAYVKDQWVYYEWHQFFSEKRRGSRNGNLIMVMSDDMLKHKGELPAELRDGIEIIKTSEYRDRLSDYLW